MKTYSVHIRACIEEYDDVTGEHRNVALEDGEVIEFTDSAAIDEYRAFSSDSLEEAQLYVDNLNF